MSDDPKSFLDMYSLSGAALFGHAGLNPYSTQGEHFSFAAAAWFLNIFWEGIWYGNYRNYYQDCYGHNLVKDILKAPPD